MPTVRTPCDSVLEVMVRTSFGCVTSRRIHAAACSRSGSPQGHRRIGALAVVDSHELRIDERSCVERFRPGSQYQDRCDLVEFDTAEQMRDCDCEPQDAARTLCASPPQRFGPSPPQTRQPRERCMMRQ